MKTNVEQKIQKLNQSKIMVTDTSLFKNCRLLLILVSCLAYMESEAQVLNEQIIWEARWAKEYLESNGLLSPWFPARDWDDGFCLPGFCDTEAEPMLIVQVLENTETIPVNMYGQKFSDYNCSFPGYSGIDDPTIDFGLGWRIKDNTIPYTTESAFPYSYEPFEENFLAHEGSINGVNRIEYGPGFTYQQLRNDFHHGHFIDSQYPSAGAVPQTSLTIGIKMFERNRNSYLDSDCGCLTNNNGETDELYYTNTESINLGGAHVNTYQHATPSAPTNNGTGLPVRPYSIEVMSKLAHGGSIDNPLQFGMLNYATSLSHVNNSFDNRASLLRPYFSEEVRGHNTAAYYSFTVPADGASINVKDANAGGGTNATAFLLYDENDEHINDGIQDSPSRSIDFNDLCAGTYKIEVYPLTVPTTRPIDITISASPTSQCLEDIDYVHNAGAFTVEFGVPDQIGQLAQPVCQTDESWMVFSGQSFTAQNFQTLLATDEKNYHLHHSNEVFRGGIFVNFNLIDEPKYVNVYHYRQKQGTTNGSDAHELFRFDESMMIPANQRIYAHNYELTAPSGSAADAIVFEVYSGDGTDKIWIAAPLVVTGIDLTSGIIGTSTTPSDIDLIIYDPPGDASVASVTNNYTVCRDVTRKITGSNGSNSELKVKFGVKGSAGFLVEQDFELSGSIDGKFGHKRDETTSNSFKECITTSNTYTTGGGKYQIGGNADLFIGSGERWSWGFQDSIYIDHNCSISSDTSFIAAVDETIGFVWSKVALDDEVSNLITDIQNLAGLQNPTNSEIIEKLKKEEQLRIWQQIIIDYKIKKASTSNTVIEPFDWRIGGANNGATITTQSTKVRNSQMSIFSENTTGGAFTAILGASGVAGGIKFSVSKEVDSATTTEDGKSTTISYIYGDGGADVHIGTIRRDPEYGTHIFQLDDNTSKTSCPYEKGYRLDQPAISASVCGQNIPFVKNIYIADADNGNPNIPGGSNIPSELIKIKICNHSNQDRAISWRDDNNLQSLGYQFNGVNQLPDLGVFQAGDCQIFDMFVFQQNANSVHDNFALRVYPTCLDGFESLLLAESDVINFYITFNSPAHYPNGDEDCDGIINIEDADYCSPSIDLTGTKSDNAIYASGSYIKSSQSIQSPAQVDYDAKTEVELDQGFEVQAGSVFHAYIDGCN